VAGSSLPWMMTTGWRMLSNGGTSGIENDRKQSREPRSQSVACQAYGDCRSAICAQLNQSRVLTELSDGGQIAHNAPSWGAGSPP